MRRACSSFSIAIIESGPSCSSEPLPTLPLCSTFFLFLRRPEDLKAEEQESVSKLRQLDPEIDQAYLFVQPCVRVMRTRTGENLAAWRLALYSRSLAG